MRATCSTTRPARRAGGWTPLRPSSTHRPSVTSRPQAGALLRTVLRTQALSCESAASTGYELLDRAAENSKTQPVDTARTREPHRDQFMCATRVMRSVCGSGRTCRGIPKCDVPVASRDIRQHHHTLVRRASPADPAGALRRMAASAMGNRRAQSRIVLRCGQELRVHRQ